MFSVDGSSYYRDDDDGIIVAAGKGRPAGTGGVVRHTDNNPSND